MGLRLIRQTTRCTASSLNHHPPEIISESKMTSAALLDVAQRAAEASHEGIAEALLGSVQVMGRVHRAQDRVARHLCEEGPHQAREPVIADPPLHVVFGGHRWHTRPNPWRKATAETASKR